MKQLMTGIVILLILSSGSVGRNKDTFKDRRSYDGAPPTIPHEGHRGLNRLDCLVCHRHGGYVPDYKKHAPISPHPEWSNCVQCHVPQDTTKVFKKSDFKRWLVDKALPKKSLETAPPVIPHTSFQRQTCLSCHAPTPASIRPTTHPERANCIQCHVYKKFKETRTLDVTQ